MKQTLKQDLQQILSFALKQAFPDQDCSGLIPRLELPPDADLGDFATPVALEGAKVLRQKPREIAEKLRSVLLSISQEIISDVQIAGPGYLNLKLKPDFLQERITWIVNHQPSYGQGILADAPSILIEFVSANPTGPLNVVSARAASLGSTLYELWKYVGIDSKSEYYINDYGNQVNLLAKSVACRFLQQKGIQIPFPEDGYQGEYIFSVADHCGQVYQQQVSGRSWLETDLEELADLFQEEALRSLIDSQKRDLDAFGVSFDRWFSERTLHDQAKPLATLDRLESSGKIYSEDGKKVFASAQYGDDKDRVVLREDGRPTYFLADIAYHQDKLERGFSRLVNIWGPDHHGYIARLQGAIEALGYPKETLEVLIAQQVNLLEDGELVKMSKRRGKFTTLKELLDEIPKDVVRYFFIMRSADSPLDFDLTLAKSRTMENPVYYIQYAHARICSILRENEKAAQITPRGTTDNDFWSHASRRNLALALLRFPDDLREIALNREIHRLASNLRELAAAFQRFYQDRDNRILGNDKEPEAAALLELSVAVRAVLRIGLKILGLGAPESM